MNRSEELVRKGSLNRDKIVKRLGDELFERRLSHEECYGAWLETVSGEDGDEELWALNLAKVKGSREKLEWLLGKIKKGTTWYEDVMDLLEELAEEAPVESVE